MEHKHTAHMSTLLLEEAEVSLLGRSGVCSLLLPTLTRGFSPKGFLVTLEITTQHATA